jgi:hypothetical protein
MGPNVSFFNNIPEFTVVGCPKPHTVNQLGRGKGPPDRFGVFKEFNMACHGTQLVVFFLNLCMFRKT